MKSSQLLFNLKHQLEFDLSHAGVLVHKLFQANNAELQKLQKERICFVVVLKPNFDQWFLWWPRIQTQSKINHKLLNLLFFDFCFFPPLLLLWIGNSKNLCFYFNARLNFCTTWSLSSGRGRSSIPKEFRLRRNTVSQPLPSDTWSSSRHENIILSLWCVACRHMGTVRP